MNTCRFSLVTVGLVILFVLFACGPQNNVGDSDDLNAALVGGERETGYAPTGYLHPGTLDRFPPRTLVPEAMSCTATLIAPDAVLTAGHCHVVSYFGLGPMLGATKADLRPISHWYRHPAYSQEQVDKAPNAESILHDVTVIKLAKPVTGVTPATLFDKVSVGPNYRVVGYGWVGENFLGIGDRRSGRVSVTRMTADHLFATSPQSGTCYGDSGGPLYVEGTLAIAGLVLGANGGCHKGTENVYTRLNDSNKDFIEKALRCTIVQSGPLPESCQRGVWSDEGQTSKQWETSLAARLTNSVRRPQLALSPNGSTLYALGYGTSLKALNAANGTVQWSVEVSDANPTAPTDPARLPDQLSVGPEGTIYVATGLARLPFSPKVRAFKPDGSVLWVNEGVRRVEPGSAGVLFAQLLEGGTLSVAGLDAKTGQPRWKYPVGAYSNTASGRSSDLQEYYLFASGSRERSGLMVFGTQGLKSKAAPGANAPFVDQDLAVASGRLVYNYGAKLVAVDLQGKQQWLNPMSDRTYGTPAVIDGSSIAVNGPNGPLSMLKLTGEILWSVTPRGFTGYSAVSPRPVSDGLGRMVVVRTSGAYLFDAKGQLVWRYSPERDSGLAFAPTQPVVWAGMIYLARTDGVLGIAPLVNSQ